jgi:hypothetical protein
VDGIAKETRDRSSDGHPFLPCSMRRQLLNIMRALLVYNFARTNVGVTKKSSCFNHKDKITAKTATDAGNL